MPINGNRISIRSGHLHEQTTPAATWTIVHNLGREVISDVMIDIGAEVHKVLPADQRIIDNNTLEITFSAPRTGRVRVA